MKFTAAALVAEARARVVTLGVAQVAEEVARGGVVLVDVREPAELIEQGRIPGSLWVPRGVLEFRADPTSPHHEVGLEPDQRVIVHSGAGARSALAAAALQVMGYSRIAHLDGGVTAWRRAGHPTV
jgi:rhodanese-related sulfurtransferase